MRIHCCTRSRTIEILFALLAATAAPTGLAAESPAQATLEQLQAELEALRAENA
jgi:hypothetical protein